MIQDSCGSLIPGQLDFANILFAGPCNRFCPWCIGKQVPAHVNINNLDLFPLHNLDGFVRAVEYLKILQIIFTGTITDPQLYRHERRLLDELRSRVSQAVQYSVHTNGVMALKKIDVFNAYDKSCISFPSFKPETYQKLMGSRHVPDLARLIEAARVEVKVSCVINDHNINELEDFLRQCQAIGVRRIVLRKLFGDSRNWNVLPGIVPQTFYRNNPVYNIDGMQVTYWNFDQTTSRSINLFPDGTLGTTYLLTKTPEFGVTSNQ